MADETIAARVTALNATLEKHEEDIKRLQQHANEIDAVDAAQDAVITELDRVIQDQSSILLDLINLRNTFTSKNPIRDETGEAVEYTKKDDYENEIDAIGEELADKCTWSTYQEFIEGDYAALSTKVNDMDINFNDTKTAVDSLNSLIKEVERRLYSEDPWPGHEQYSFGWLPYLNERLEELEPAFNAQLAALSARLDLLEGKSS